MNKFLNNNNNLIIKKFKKKIITIGIRLIHYKILLILIIFYKIYIIDINNYNRKK